jgi:hypothetical protein
VAPSALSVAAQCPLLAFSGHSRATDQCPLLGVKLTCRFALQMSAFDPKRTSAVQDPASQRTSDHLACYPLIRQT